MSSEISLQGAPRPAPMPAPAVPQVAAQTHADASAPELRALEKPVINVDPKESQRQISDAIARLNEMMQNNGTDLNFSRDEVLNQTVITVKNTESGKVVRQIPDITFLKVAHNIESLKGLLHNTES